MKKIFFMGIISLFSISYAYESCYDIGYKFGSCVVRSMKGLKCYKGTDISIPIRCRNKKETKLGIKAGMKLEY